MDEIFVTITKVKYSGPFHMLNMYQQMYKIFDEQGFWVVEGGKSGKFELQQREGGDDYIIIWECTNNYDNYVRAMIKYTLSIFGVKPVQEKGKTHTGYVDIEIAAKLQIDWQEKWESNLIYRQLRWFYDKFLYKDQLEQWRKKCWDDTYTIANRMKRIFYTHI